MKTFSQLKTQLNESSLARVYQHTMERNIGMVTAHRNEYTADENKARNRELESHIRKAGYGFVNVKGRYVENYGTPEAKNVDEHSYLIVGKKGDDKGELRNFLRGVGEKYGQDSVLHKAHNEKNAKLIGTKEGGFPGKDKEFDVGEFHPNRAGEFHTAMRNKRTFAFAESIQFLNPISFFNRQESDF